MKRLGLVVCLLLVGCATPQEPCPRCSYIEERIKAAEQFMPGYWVKYQTRELEPTGDEHSPEYEVHHKWIEARDALNRTEGKIGE